MTGHVMVWVFRLVLKTCPSFVISLSCNSWVIAPFSLQSQLWFLSCWCTWVPKYLHLLQVGRQDSWLAVRQRVVWASWNWCHRGRRRCSGQRHHDGGWQAAAAAGLTLCHRSAGRGETWSKMRSLLFRKSFPLHCMWNSKRGSGYGRKRESLKRGERKEKDRKGREEICSQYEQIIPSCDLRLTLTKPVNQTTEHKHSSKRAWPDCRCEDIHENSSCGATSCELLIWLEAELLLETS